MGIKLCNKIIIYILFPFDLVNIYNKLLKIILYFVYSIKLLLNNQFLIGVLKKYIMLIIIFYQKIIII